MEDTGSSMQIDLMQPLEVDRVLLDGEPVSISGMMMCSICKHPLWPMAVSISWKSVITANPEWRQIAALGWWRDLVQRPQRNSWISVACQGLGASVWYPNKDHQKDEPDSAAMHIITNKGQTAVSNGRFRGMTENADGSLTWNWAVVNPINNYNLIPHIGKYEDHHSTYQERPAHWTWICGSWKAYGSGHQSRFT